MSDARSQQDSREPAERERRTIAEESRERWAPDHPDVKEAGDDGPHKSDATNVARAAGDGVEGSETQR